MFQLMAYGESIAPNSALVNVAVIADDTVYTAGDDLRVPGGLPYLIGETGAIDATGAGRIQIQSPSLRRMANLDVAPFATGLTITNHRHINMHADSPLGLVPDESVEALVYNTETVAALHYVGLWFGDGPQVQVSGEIFTVRATASLTAIATAWVSSNLTFGTDLPVGNYNVVGMRVVETNGVFARLIFKGGTWRPGCIVSPTVTQGDNSNFRRGALGVWGNFHTNAPPSMEFIGAAGAVTPEVYLDLMPA